MKRETHAPIDTETLHRLSVRIREHMGLHFAPERWADLERGLRHAARDFAFEGESAVFQCAEWLLRAPLSREQIATLARHLTIGETYFFRDPPVFEALRRHVLPELVRARRERDEKLLRVWSAACCTGEEPYSLAILLAQSLPALTPDWRQWQISILGTDLNPHFLQKAQVGVYSAWSFRDSARDEQSRFFNKTASGHYEISAEIRSMVTFAPLNLMTDHFPAQQNFTSAQDMIFCRNVLMYFQKEEARNVVEKLARCLRDDGFLAPSASEASPQLFSPLQSVAWPGAIFYRKTRLAPASSASDAPRLAVVPRTAPLASQTPSRIFRKAEAANTPQLALPKSAVPQSARDWHERARRCADTGQLDEALRCCDNAIALEKMNARHYYLRASIIVELHGAAAGHAAEMEQSLRRAIYLEPDFAPAHFALGHLERRRGNSAAARRSFATALRLLSQADPQAPLPDCKDMTAGHMAEIIAQTLEELNA